MTGPLCSRFWAAVSILLWCLALPTTQSAPTHKRLGINLSGLSDWNTEHPLVDVFRLSRQWISQKQGEPWGKGPALDLDAHGWIRRLDTGCFAETPILTSGHAPDGNYICLYDGSGQIEFGANARIVSRQPGRIVANINARQNGTFLQLRQTDPSNPIRNIRFIMPGFEPSYGQEPFHPAFLRRWRGFDTIRFMDWLDTNGSTQKDWADRPRLDDSTWTIKGAPVELMTDLSNRLKANPWFTLPHLASDDYVRQFAKLVKAELHPSLKVYLEYSNEVWNGGFAQHLYAEQRGRNLELGPKDRPWEGAALFYAQRSMQIFRIWEQVFGGHSRLVRVLAWQAAGGEYWTDQMLLGQQDAGKNCDALAIAPYISFMPSPDHPSLKPDDVARWPLDRLLDYLETNSLPQCIGWMKLQKAVAEKYKLPLVCYEAGQHLVGVGGAENNEALTKLLVAANQHPRMGVLYARYLDAWRDLGGDLLCIFSSVAASSKWGSWGLLEGTDEASSPKFDAVQKWRAE
jgi:hypothetical protein